MDRSYPYLQKDYHPADIGIPANTELQAGGTVTGSLVDQTGFPARTLAVSAKSTKNGTLRLIGYLDSAGSVEAFRSEAALTANDPAVVKAPGDTPFRSWKIQIVNADGVNAGTCEVLAALAQA